MSPSWCLSGKDLRSAISRPFRTRPAAARKCVPRVKRVRRDAGIRRTVRGGPARHRAGRSCRVSALLPAAGVGASVQLRPARRKALPSSGAMCALMRRPRWEISEERRLASAREVAGGASRGAPGATAGDLSIENGRLYSSLHGLASLRTSARVHAPTPWRRRRLPAHSQTRGIVRAEAANPLQRQRPVGAASPPASWAEQIDLVANLHQHSRVPLLGHRYTFCYGGPKSRGPRIRPISPRWRTERRSANSSRACRSRKSVVAR
jgi:hypothetical protein